jgi:hypothetical protein
MAVIPPSRCEAAQAAMEWRNNFQPHAVILTERTRLEPIFVAAIVGARRLLRIDFDLNGERESYINKALEAVQRRLAKWNGTIPALIAFRDCVEWWAAVPHFLRSRRAIANNLAELPESTLRDDHQVDPLGTYKVDGSRECQRTYQGSYTAKSQQLGLPAAGRLGVASMCPISALANRFHLNDAWSMFGRAMPPAFS